jgi:hypothetical protein
MYMVALAFNQPGCLYRVYKAIGGAVVEHRGRSLSLIAQLDLNRVTLIGADASLVFVKRKPLLVAGLHY